jgi:DNA-binding response OmpR family regulator
MQVQMIMSCAETLKADIKHLRQKLQAAGAIADLIETVYAVGYRLKPNV